MMSDWRRSITFSGDLGERDDVVVPGGRRSARGLSLLVHEFGISVFMNLRKSSSVVTTGSIITPLMSGGCRRAQ